MRDTLQLTRKNGNGAWFRTADATAAAGGDGGAVKVVLSKPAWSVPIVQPNDVLKVKLCKCIAANDVLPVLFRMPLGQCEPYGD